MKRVVIALIASLLPLAAAAQQESSGMYVSLAPDFETTELEGGRTLQHGPYHQFTTTADESDLFANQLGRCSGTAYYSSSGVPEAGAGICYNQDPEGNAYWFWWRIEESATEKCPMACGTFGIIDGIGEFAGVSGTGRFEMMAQYPDTSNVGRWTLTWEKK